MDISAAQDKGPAMSLRDTARLIASGSDSHSTGKLPGTGNDEAAPEDIFSSDFDRDNVKLAAAIGAGAGAIAGGIIAYQGSR